MNSILLIIAILGVPAALANVCVNSPLGSRHPNPISCSSFIICEAGESAALVECPLNQLYDYVRDRCDAPSRVTCFEGELQETCPEVDDPCVKITFPNHEDCESFYICYEGMKIPAKCRDGFYWDFVLNSCVDHDTVQCHPDTINAPTTTTTSTTTEPPPITPDPNVFDCPSWIPGEEATLHPHTVSCSMYFVCWQNRSFLMTCAEGTLFDIRQNACYREDGAQCFTHSLL